MGTCGDHIRQLRKKCVVSTSLGLAATLLVFGAIWPRMSPQSSFPFLEHTAVISFVFLWYPALFLPFSGLVVALFRPENRVHAFALAFSVSGGMLLPLPIWLHLLEPQLTGDLLGLFVAMFSFMLLTSFLFASFTSFLQSVRRRNPSALL